MKLHIVWDIRRWILISDIQRWRREWRGYAEGSERKAVHRLLHRGWVKPKKNVASDR